MKTKLIGFLAFVTLAFAACGGSKSNESQEDRENAQKVAFTGPWETGMLSFTNDQCAFKLDFQNDTDFLIRNFTMYCQKAGEYGLYAPLRLVKADVSQFSADDLVGFTPPAGAKVLAIQGTSKLEPRGWIDEAQKKFYFAVAVYDTVLWNRLSLSGQMEGDLLAITDMKMREGFTVQDKILFFQQTNPTTSLMWTKSAWSQLKLPDYAVPSTDSSNRNYLYCVQVGNPSNLGLVDFVTKKYEMDSTHWIGDMGFIGLNSENRVYMARTETAFVRSENGFQKYQIYASTNIGYGTPISISFQDDGFAILTWNSRTNNLCRFVQNDVFRGRYTGWNP